MPKVHKYVVGVLSTNFYVIEEENTFSVIDPGGIEAVKITRQFIDKGLKLKNILITHSHPDHIGFAKNIKQLAPETKILAHQEAKKILPTFIELAKTWDLPFTELKPEEIESINAPVITLEKSNLQVIHTPGHSPDSICFYLREKNLLFSGDTLFQYSIGRTDLPFGNMNQIRESIINKLYFLPDKTIVLPGHGEKTTIGFEKMNNLYVAIN